MERMIAQNCQDSFHWLILHTQHTQLYQCHQPPYLLTFTHPFNGPLSRTTQVSRYQKGKTNLDFTEARDSEWQWNQLGHMQVCTSLQTDNQASTHRSVFYRLDNLPAAKPTASKHWRHINILAQYFLKTSGNAVNTPIPSHSYQLFQHHQPLNLVNILVQYLLKMSGNAIYIPIPPLLSGNSDPYSNSGFFPKNYLFPFISHQISQPEYTLQLCIDSISTDVPSVLWRCWLGGRKGTWPVKNWVVGCWHGCLSGARCRLTYGPADATATHGLLLQ